MSLAPLVGRTAQLSSAEIRRYSRHLAVPEIGVAGQERLKSARVVCVGAGGLGSPVLMYLAAAGVGTIGIVEFDRVEESNLQRQVIHGQSDIGRPKAASAGDRIQEINPHVEVVTHNEALTSDNALDILADYDLIVDGADNFATRYLVNDAAVLLRKPYVWGSIYRFDGQAAVFWAEHGPCYRCLYPYPPEPGSAPSCAEAGVLGVVCATIGSIQATEAVKLVTGAGETLLGSLVVYNALTANHRKITVPKDPDCPVCGANPTITTLTDYPDRCQTVPEPAAATVTAGQLRDWMTAGRPIYLVDVREPYEHDIVRIPGSVLIPKDGILSGSALTRLPQDRQIVLYCKSGIRSAQALAAVRAAGFSEAVHLQGGVIAWATEVDPSLPTY